MRIRFALTVSWIALIVSKSSYFSSSEKIYFQIQLTPSLLAFWAVVLAS